jgi:hypothetical protein
VSKRSRLNLVPPVILNSLARRGGFQNLSYKILLTVVILLSALIVLLLKIRANPRPIQAGWFNDSWHYRTSYTFTNSGSADSNKKIKVDIDTATLISASKLQTDCGDSRFTDQNGNLLSYYIDSTAGACNTNSTDYYLLLPSIPTGNFAIYHYYDNSTAINGFQTSQFTQATFTPNSANTASEETSPGPIASWKFDEGYHQGGSIIPITGIEQYLEITTAEYSINDSPTYAPADNSLGVITWDSTKYTNPTVYFEAVIHDNGLSGNVYAALFDVGGSQVPNSEIFTNNGTYTLVRSSALSLTNGSQYTVRLKEANNVGSSNSYLKSARLVIVQSDPAKITATQNVVDIGKAQTVTLSTASTLTDPRIYNYNSSSFSPLPSAYFEAALRGASPQIIQYLNIITQTYTTSDSPTYTPTDNSLGIITWDSTKYTNPTVYFEAIIKDNGLSGNVYAALFDVGGSQVPNSEIFTNNGTYTLVRSSALALTNGTQYTVRLKETNGYNASVFSGLKAARLIIVQSDPTKITDTLTSIELGNSQSGITGTTYTAFTDPKIFRYDQTKFSPTPESSGDVSFSATLKITDAADAALLELYNQTDSVSVATLTRTGASTWGYVSASNIDSSPGWDPAHPDEYILRIKCTDNNGGGCSASLANAKVELYQSNNNGITALETYRHLVTTLATDSDTGFSSQSYLQTQDSLLDASNFHSEGGTFNYYFESVIKTVGATGQIQLYNDTNNLSLPNTTISTSSTGYTRLRTSDITSSFDQYPNQSSIQVDVQIRNSSTSTTSVASSWLITQISNLTTTGSPTAFADLYNLTDNTVVANSEIGVSGNTWQRLRSGTLSLTPSKDYVVRARSSISGVPVYLANGKIILSQSSPTGIGSLETYQNILTNTFSRASTSYGDADVPLQFTPASYTGVTFSYYFEALLKATGGTAYAILKDDTNLIDISTSAVNTASTAYTRLRSSTIGTSMPSSTVNLDVRLKNLSSGQTTAISQASLIVKATGQSYAGLTADSSSNGYHANIANATWKTGSQCQSNSCLQFNGISDYLVVSNPSKLNFTGSDSFTISTWFKHDPKSSGTDVLLAKYNTATSTDGGFKIQMESDGDLTVGIDDDNSAFPEDSVTSTLATYDDSRWHHLAMVKNGTSSLSLYIDGVLIGQDTSLSATGSLANTDSLYIGIDGDGASNPWTGQLDELKIYPYAISLDSVKIDHNVSSGTYVGTNQTDISSLLAYFKLDEKSGSTAYDSSTNSIPATLGGGDSAPTWTTGQYGSALRFDGANDNLSIGSTIASIKSIAFWFYPRSSTTPILQLSPSISIGVSNNTITTSGFSSPTIYLNGSPSSTLTPGKWTHFTLTTTTPVTGSQILLGQNSTGFLNGSLDDFRLYSSTLTTSQITTVLNADHPLGGSPLSSQLAYYKFDEGYGTTTANWGIGGTGLSGNFGSGTSAPNWTNNGKFGKALNFDGDNDYVTFSSNILDPQQGTVSLWWNPQEILFNSAHPILTARDSSHIFDIYYYQDTLYGGWYQPGNDDRVKLLISTIQQNTWNHVVVTWTNGGETKLYLNGQFMLSTSNLNASWSSPSIEAFIARDNTTPAFAKTIIDEVKIYNSALTSDQIALDYNQGKSLILGSLSSSGSGNTAPPTSASQEYCVPGDSTPCSPPVAEWKFDEGIGTTAYDTSGNSNPAVMAAGDSAPTWTTGKIGKAPYFDGINDYFQVDDSPNLSLTGNLTVEAWVYYSTLPSIAGNYPIIGKIDAGNRNGYVLFHPRGSTFNMQVCNASTCSTGTAPAGTLSLNTWYHVTAIYDGSSIQILINGGSTSTTNPANTNPTDGTGVLRIGYNLGNNYTKFSNNKIDQVKIYNYARTPAQVAWDYNRGKPIGHWKMDDCQGTQIADWSGNGNHGVLSIGTSGSQTTVGTCSTFGAWASGSSGKLNSSLNFDGNDDFINVGTTYPLGTNPFTLSVWYKGSQNQSWRGLIGSVNTPSNTIGYALQNHNGKLNLWHNGYAYTGTTPINDNNWHHCIAIINGNNSTLYLDGKPELRFTPSSNTTVNNSQPVWIGGWGDPLYLVSGQIDDARIYNYALTPEQVKQVYNGDALRFGPREGQPN